MHFIYLLLYLAKEIQAQPKNCCLCYTWPILPEEEGKNFIHIYICTFYLLHFYLHYLHFVYYTHWAVSGLQEKVLQFAEDLDRAGIPAKVDLTHKDYENEFKNWIRGSDYVLLIWTPSYSLRASDASTLTHLEEQEIHAKKNNNRDSVLPVALIPGIRFPAKYSDVIGAMLRNATQYYQTVPDMAAKFLGIETHPDVVSILRVYA